MLLKLQALEQATTGLALKDENAKNNHNVVEQINDVDARVQSLAEQVTVTYLK